MLLHLMGAAAASAVAASAGEAEAEDGADGTQVAAASLTGRLPPGPCTGRSQPPVREGLGLGLGIGLELTLTLTLTLT